MAETARKILVPTDLSGPSFEALPPAVDLAKALGAELLIATVVDDPFGAPATGPLSGELSPALVRYVEDLRATAARVLEEKVRGLPVTARTRVLAQRDAARAVVDLARDERADLVLMRTHGRTGLRRWFLGSVAERVVRTSSVPVLTLHQIPRPFQPRRVLLCTDLSDASWDAFPWAARFAQTLHADLSVLSVVEEPYYFTQIGVGERFIPILGEAAPRVQQHLELRLSDLSRDLAGVRTEVLVRTAAHVAKEIVQVAEERGAGLVVLATRGNTGFEHALMGSTAEKVVRWSQVPVLSVRRLVAAAG